MTEPDSIRLVVNAATNTVHHETCSYVATSDYIARWASDEAYPEDHACRICLPDGLPR